MKHHIFIVVLFLLCVCWQVAAQSSSAPIIATDWNLSTTSPSVSPIPFPHFNRECCGASWGNIEVARMQFSWSSLDVWTNQTLAHNSQFLYTLKTVPAWANSTKAAYDPPSDLSTVTSCPNGTLRGQTSNTTDCQLKEFIVALMRHVCLVSSQPASPLLGACRLKFFEIWNEFNTNSYWNGTDAQLAQIANDATIIVRAYCADCYIIAGSVSAGGDGYRPNGQPAIYYSALLDLLIEWAKIPGASLPDMVSIHPYPSRTDVIPVPFPTTIISNGSLFCSTGVPNIYCRVPVYQEISIVQGTAVLQNPAIVFWAALLPVVGTEGGWGETKNVCNGTDCDPLSPDVIFLRSAYISEWMIALAAQKTPWQMWYAWNDQCWGTMWGTNAVEDACPNNPLVPKGDADWFQAWTQTASWLASATITGPLTKTPVTGGNVWTLPLDLNGRPAQIAFFDGWLTSYTEATRFTQQQDLFGNTTSTNGSVSLSQEPVLLTSSSSLLVPVTSFSGSPN